VLGESSNTRWLIEAAGGIDVSASMGITDPVPISAEAILAAAPEVVLVPEAGLTSVNGIEGLLKIGGIGETPAGRGRRVLAYDDQLLLGNGPRTAETLTRLRDDLQRLATSPEGVPSE
jgi:iron complex transport system substrate-binding protein